MLPEMGGGGVLVKSLKKKKKKPKLKKAEAGMASFSFWKLPCCYVDPLSSSDGWWYIFLWGWGVRQ